MSQKVVVIGPNLIDQSKGTFHVHKAGCADTRKSQYRFHQNDADRSETFASQRELIEEVYCDIMAENESYSWRDLADEFYFFPCVTLPEEA